MNPGDCACVPLPVAACDPERPWLRVPEGDRLRVGEGVPAALRVRVAEPEPACVGVPS